jgi:hypothetical protein
MKALVKYSYFDETEDRQKDAQIEVEMPFDRADVIDAAKMLLMKQDDIEEDDFQEKRYRFHEVYNPVHADIEQLRMRIDKLEAELQTCDALLRDIRYEVGTYPMDKPAKDLVEKLYEMTH